LKPVQVDHVTTERAAGSGTVTGGPIDIIMLTHNRLDHLVATVDALEANTPEPYRLTIVDNASGPELRNWLAENRHRFERLILRPTNEHVPAFTHGINATTSDPFVVTDPDVVLPELEPSWMSHMIDLLERHPDFGLLAVGCDPSNRPPPPIFEAEVIDPATLVDGEIVETGVGTIFQFIRRDALVTDYRSDAAACTAVKRAGYRAGWSPDIRGLHLGWDDFRLHPGHLLSKREGGIGYPESYGEVGLIARPATLEELALAAPVLAETRRRGIPEAAVLELAWEAPAVGAAAPESIAVVAPAADPLPFDAGAAGAVVLQRPPAEQAEALVHEACRVASRLVVAVAPLATFDARVAAELAPKGWTGHETRGIGDLPLALARAAQADESLTKRLEGSVADDRERWLELFAAGAFGEGELRLWVWERDEPVAGPERVTFDPERVSRWRPDSLTRPAIRQVGLIGRFWRRADVSARVDVWRGRARRSISRRRSRTNPSNQ
jgi:hypothetical protein